MKIPALSTLNVFASAVVLRVFLLLYGLLQDEYSLVKYTDIDYFVFTDAARYVSRGLSPYKRETYRYTPLLAWVLVPTTWSTTAWFSFGKVLFAIADIAAGWLIVLLLRSPPGGSMSMQQALKFGCMWLLNPMVATISTRGSSEGLLGVMIIALLWAVTQRQLTLAGVFLGLAVHFKIYPFIYASSIIWYLDTPHAHSKVTANSETTSSRGKHIAVIQPVLDLLTPDRLTLTLASLSTFTVLNVIMYSIYSTPFLTHTYFHHLTRIDHRHNFSPYNTLLYVSSASPSLSNFKFENIAFVPQLLLSAIIIPLALAKKDLAGTMLAQTFAFVAFNKVCTSQYFLWYLIFLPFYLPYSRFLRSPRLGFTALVFWTSTQALWLQQGYKLEFLGSSTFVPGLWSSALAFFAVNMWILGIIIEDVAEIGFLRNKSIQSTS